MTPLISFLSDYGYRDEYVGVCHGVIAGRCPRARVIDLTHGIARQDVRAGALALADALPFVPAGVHLAVVDPGVGGERRALALATVRERRLLVGPDNGLLMPAAERFGGVSEAVDVSVAPVRLAPVSHTFHGRDIFAPVAAALACGAPLGELGEPLDAAGLQALELPLAELRDGELRAHALRCDGFGNVLLDASPQQLEALGVQPGGAVRVRCAGGEHQATLARAFSQVAPGRLLVYEDAQGTLALAANRGSAARLLGIARDEPVVLAPW
jgi:S-adenosyl-L-methionine hydrolase (adenosine-forming)